MWDRAALREIAELRNCAPGIASIFCDSVRQLAGVPLAEKAIAEAVKQLAQEGSYTVVDVVRVAWTLDGWPAAKLEKRFQVSQPAAKAKQPAAEAATEPKMKGKKAAAGPEAAQEVKTKQTVTGAIGAKKGKEIKPIVRPTAQPAAKGKQPVATAVDKREVKRKQATARPTTEPEAKRKQPVAEAKGPPAAKTEQPVTKKAAVEPESRAKKSAAGAAGKRKKSVSKAKARRRGKVRLTPALEAIMRTLGTDDVDVARQFCQDVRRIADTYASLDVIARAIRSLSEQSSYTPEEVARLVVESRTRSIERKSIPVISKKTWSRQAPKQKQYARPQDSETNITYSSTAPKLTAAQRRRLRDGKRYVIHPDGTVTGLPSGADGRGDSSTNRQAGVHGSGDSAALDQSHHEEHDGSKYWGYMSRENGQFGSHPLFDDYGDESEP